MNIWLVLFIPAVIIWATACLIQIKCEKSNRVLQKPVIFHTGLQHYLYHTPYCITEKRILKKLLPSYTGLFNGHWLFSTT
jgi:hypothetical protein